MRCIVAIGWLLAETVPPLCHPSGTNHAYFIRNSQFVMSMNSKHNWIAEDMENELSRDSVSTQTYYYSRQVLIGCLGAARPLRPLALHSMGLLRLRNPSWRRSSLASTALERRFKCKRKLIVWHAQAFPHLLFHWSRSRKAINLEDSLHDSHSHLLDVWDLRDGPSVMVLTSYVCYELA